MRLSGIYLYNSICQSLALTVLLHKFIPERYRKARDILFFTYSLILQMLMIEVQYFILLGTFPLALSIYGKPRKFLQSAGKILDAHFFVVLYVVSASSMLQLLFPQLSDFLYNLIIGKGLMVLTYLFSRKRTLLKNSHGRIIIEGIVYLFFSLVMPLLQSDFNANLLYSAAIFLILLVICALTIMARSETERERRASELHQINYELQAMQQQYRSAIQIRHYTMNLVKSLGAVIHDGHPEAIQAYFSQYIDDLPEIKPSSSLYRLKNDSIRNLLILYQKQADMSNTNLIVMIEDEFCFDNELESGLFKLLSIYLDNALEAAPGGIIRLTIHRDPITIILANTIESQKMSSQEPRGFGLGLAREIIQENPCLESATQRIGAWYIQTIYVKG